MGKFCELTYEEAFIDLFEQNGWEYTRGDDLHPRRWRHIAKSV